MFNCFKKQTTQRNGRCYICCFLIKSKHMHNYIKLIVFKKTKKKKKKKQQQQQTTNKQKSFFVFY